MKVPDEEQPIDFSTLDPARHGKPWAAMVSRTVEASLERPSAFAELWSSLPRSRPTLLALAALAVLTWLPWLMREEASTTTTEPALALVHFEQRHDVTAMLESADGY